MEVADVSALLPLKGHSDRVPGKNLKLFGGKPLCLHILASLSEAKHIKEILVDTDSREIAALVTSHFPEVRILERPPHLLGSKVPMTPLIEHDLRFAAHPFFIQTHATTPLISAATLDRAIETFFAGLHEGFDSLMGVNRHQTRFYTREGKPINHDLRVMVPSQDMPPIYEDNSNFYINSVENFYRRFNRVGEKVLFFEVSKVESLDIDEEEDFIITEAVYHHLQRQGSRSEA